MDQAVKQLKNAFGKAIVARDFEALDVILAPWLTPDQVFRAISAEVEEMGEEWGLPAGKWPTEFEVGEGALDYEQLREPSGFPAGIDVPEQVTAENYVGWHVVTAIAHADDAFDAYFDAWFAVVRLQDGLHVGSLELVDPD
ncbi:MAG: hypothetical protein ACSLFF_05005 [Solirubrobacterales bacterium]